MSETKVKYFIVDFDQNEIWENKTLLEALNMINEWLKNEEEADELIEGGQIVLIKGTKIEFKVETMKKAVQK